MSSSRFIDWRKSTLSGGGDNCVEVAVATDGSGAVGVRDSKNPKGPVLVFSSSEWAASIDGVRLGEFGS